MLVKTDLFDKAIDISDGSLGRKILRDCSNTNQVFWNYIVCREGAGDHGRYIYSVLRRYCRNPTGSRVAARQRDGMISPNQAIQLPCWSSSRARTTYDFINRRTVSSAMWDRAGSLQHGPVIRLVFCHFTRWLGRSIES